MTKRAVSQIDRETMWVDPYWLCFSLMTSGWEDLGKCFLSTLSIAIEATAVNARRITPGGLFSKKKNFRIFLSLWGRDSWLVPIHVDLITIISACFLVTPRYCFSRIRSTRSLVLPAFLCSARKRWTKWTQYFVWRKSVLEISRCDSCPLEILHNLWTGSF